MVEYSTLNFQVNFFFIVTFIFRIQRLTFIYFVIGLLTLHISDERYGRIKVHIKNEDSRGIQLQVNFILIFKSCKLMTVFKSFIYKLQTHPNVDKELFRSTGCVGLKNPAKPFPLHTDVGVLKWRFQTTADSSIPLNG